MTPEERTALMEKMRSATTPEERQKIAEATHAEMEKRAQEKGITLPDHRGPHGGFGPRSGTRPQAPATN
jgi:DNA invertase Pin-like site-specific DNA recombinase